MKNYKKGLLAVMVISAMGLMAAEDKTIYVTTFVDEDGENLQACSLREAIKTAKLDTSYGGCNIGRTIRHDGAAPDVIQLKEGVYKLDRELVVESSINIFGASVFNYTKRSPITNLYPTKEALKTTIDGQSKVRLFNTIDTQASLNVNQVILKNGYAAKDSNLVNSGNGGAFAVAGNLGIISSEIVNARAANEGGAIYAVGQNSAKTVKIEDTLIHQNSAENYGSVIAMDCKANLTSTQVNLQIGNSSIVRNGSTKDRSTLDVCGQATVSINNSTIAKNKAAEQIIKIVHNSHRPLTSTSSLTALSNTIVENEAPSILNYDDTPSISLGHNVLAFNNGLSCLYGSQQSDPDQQLVRFAFYHNAIQSSGNSRCALPKLAEDTPFPYEYIELKSVSFTSVLSNFLEPAADNRYLGLYYPIDRKSNTDLIDIKDTDCNRVDQRGIQRITDATLILDPDAKNTCDIGSVEARRFIAADVADLKNHSYHDLLNNFQDNIDDIKSLLEDKDTPKEQLEGLKEELKEFEDLLKYTKQYQKYRAIYVDPFNLAMPSESLEGSTIKLHALNKDNFDVEMKVLGVGELVGTGSSAIINGVPNDPALKCEWKPEMSRMMMYRTDGNVTSTTDFEYCSYTLHNKQTGETSSGILKASFVNIAPVAKNDTYTINPESNLSVKVNPLSNDFDDDGPVSGTETYYSDTPIRFESIDSGLIMTAEREGPCPDKYIRDTCYGGEISFKVKNNLSQFDYQATYNYFDADGAMSNTATILLKNSAKNTNESSSGGGAFGIWGLLGLVALGAYRQRRIQK